MMRHFRGVFFRPALLGMILAALASSIAAAESGAEASQATKLAGTWLGPLKIGAIELRLALKIAVDETGKMTATLDSIDQGAKDMPVDAITLVDGALTAELKLIGGKFVGKLDEQAGQIVGTWTQGPGSLPLVLKKTEGDVQLNRPQEPKPPFPYRGEEVQFDNAADKVRLAGTLTLPEGAGPFPAVVLISGSGPQNRDEFLLGHRPFLVLADHLTRHGVAVRHCADVPRTRWGDGRRRF
jgi:hypothetical protein